MDRQDIDALLIGALYGELTPADEARLAAHLESHPTDRGALDDLKSARKAVRESRIFDLQLDPPQAVSALLLQEAHRRAPKRAAAASDDHKESWFLRFTKMFLAHPAMAAAAMLVLVVGVAGTLYMRKGDQFASKEVAQEQQLNAGSAATETVAMTPPEAAKNEADNKAADEGTATGAGSAYSVQLAEPNAQDPSVAASDRARAEQVARFKAQKDALERQDKAKKTAIMVDTPRPQPKELDESRAKAPAKATSSAKPATKGAAKGGEYARSDDFDGALIGGTSGVTGSSGGGGAPAGVAAPSGRVATTTPSTGAPARNAPAPSPPPPPAAAPAPVTIAQGTAKPTAPAAEKPAASKEAEKSEAKPDAAKDSALIAWAKSEHTRAVQLASKGDCSGAAKVAVLISNRAPDYYSQFVSTDRGLKKCQAYIAAERDADAERSGKARAQKRVNADEPAAH